MDLREYRATPSEVARVASLTGLVPPGPLTILDAGARDGHLSVRLAERGAWVTALDLEAPRVVHPRVACVQGDVTALQFADGSFDVACCTEVLEHLRPEALATACTELARVARDCVIVGVPYEQDLRVGRTTCARCGARNPPWGHLNAFDRDRLETLFPAPWRTDAVEFVGSTRERTNAVSSWLMDRAGNPFGTYDQDEPCVRCGARLVPPPPRTAGQKVLTGAAAWIERVQRRLTPARANWIHVRLASAAVGPEAASAQ